MDEHAQHGTELAKGIKEVDPKEFGSAKAEHAEFQCQFDQEKITQILKEFLPIIRRMAGAMALKNPFSLDVEDLTSAGAMGLLSALKRYDPTRDIKFRTFAEYRIRGMMLDEIRAMDWVPRSFQEFFFSYGVKRHHEFWYRKKYHLRQQEWSLYRSWI